LGHLLLKIKNARITFLNRPIKELQQFRKEIMDEMARHKKNFIGHSVYLDNNTNKVAPPVVEDTTQVFPKIMMEIKIEDSLIFIPRSSQDVDCFFMTMQKCDIKLENDYREKLELPIPLEIPFKLVQNTFVLESKPAHILTKVKVSVVTIHLQQLNAYVHSGTRKDHVGSSTSLVIQAASSTESRKEDGWSMDSVVDVHFNNDYDFTMNLGMMTEMQEILKINSKEPSKLFTIKGRFLERMIMKMHGKDTGIKLTKAVIPKNIVEEKKEQQEAEEERLKKENKLIDDKPSHWSHYLNDLTRFAAADRKERYPTVHIGSMNRLV